MQAVLLDACVLLRHLARISHNSTIRRRGANNANSFSSAPLALDPAASLRDPSSFPSDPGAVPTNDAFAVRPDLDSEIRECSGLPQTPVSLQMLMKAGQELAFGNTSASDDDDGEAIWATPLQRRSLYRSKRSQERVLLSMAQLLRHEIPVRLAQRISDLDRVPYMRDMPSVKSVKDVYRNSFQTLREVPPIATTKDESDFAYVLSQLYEKHSGVLVEMARGAYELRESLLRSHSDPHGDFALLSECHAFLDRFYTSRIGIRVLVGQYLALRQQYQYQQGTCSRNSNYVGMICLDCSPRDVVRQAADLSRRLCRQRYGGRAPLVQMSGRLDLTFPYIPAYLQYVLLELLKNSLRAVSERHRQGPLPPVQVVIADGHDQEDVVIKIGDEGGGIARSQVGKIWSYLYTTADPNVQRQFIGRGGDNGGAGGADTGTPKDHDVQDSSPIAGLGYGLPISRSYCRYFGGDLSLESMHGYGTDVFIHLKRLGDTHEPSLDVPPRTRN